MTTRKILITGAAGEIGTFLTSSLPTTRYELVLADIRKPDTATAYPFIELDIADLEQFTAACAGIDTVVHLAADRRTNAPWETLLPANVIGAYNAFEAAHRAGCRRVIFASSIHTGSGYPDEVQVHTDMLTRPGNLYGATKVWGEAVARVYADQKGLSCLCLRFGGVGSRDNARRLTDPIFPPMYLTYEDITHLITVCIDAPDDLRYGIFNGVSNNRYKKLDITNAREILGYNPQDDAFELLEQFPGQS
jgi:nucleoside-diphosphate-sugar epimerase